MQVEMARTRAAAVAVSLAQASAVAAGVVLGAKVRIFLPFTPVPITMQTFALLAGASVAPPLIGAAGAALYLALASAGLSVIAGPGVFGPTGGYLLGFVAAAAVVGGWDRRSGLDLAWRFALAHLLIYACGASWLAAWSASGLERAIELGVAPFVVGDLIKAAAAWGLALAAGRAARR